MDAIQKPDKSVTYPSITTSGETSRMIQIQGSLRTYLGSDAPDFRRKQNEGSSRTGPLMSCRVNKTNKTSKTHDKKQTTE
jgi:hypothetical protein